MYTSILCFSQDCTSRQAHVFELETCDTVNVTFWEVFKADSDRNENLYQQGYGYGKSNWNRHVGSCYTWCTPDGRLPKADHLEQGHLRYQDLTSNSVSLKSPKQPYSNTLNMSSTYIFQRDVVNLDVSDGSTKGISKPNSTYTILLKTSQSDEEKKADSIASQAVNAYNATDDGRLSGKRLG